MQHLTRNFNEMFKREDLFCPATEEQITKLSALFGNAVYVITDFYRQYQPNNIPMLDSYVRILGIDMILAENTMAEPGRYLAEYGVYVFAVTVGGNVLCIDTNDSQNGDASILLVDCNFCSYNSKYNCVEIGIISEELMTEELLQEGMIILNYPNIRKYVKKIENSFMEFMTKLSNNEYEDIEALL